MILQQLDELRMEVPECATVALIDLTSGLVLGVSSERSSPQERLDALSKAAVEFLGTPAAPPGGTDQTLSEPAWLFTETDACLFLRSRQDPTEALALVCSPGVALAPAMQAARRRLDLISDMH